MSATSALSRLKPSGRSVQCHLVHSGFWCDLVVRMCPLWSGCVPCGQDVSLVVRMCPLWSGCVPCGQDVSLVVRMCPLWSGCVPCGQDVSLVVRMCPLWSGCVPCGQDVSLVVRMCFLVPLDDVLVNEIVLMSSCALELTNQITLHDNPGMFICQNWHNLETVFYQL